MKFLKKFRIFEDKNVQYQIEFIKNIFQDLVDEYDIELGRMDDYGMYKVGLSYDVIDFDHTKNLIQLSILSNNPYSQVGREPLDAFQPDDSFTWYSYATETQLAKNKSDMLKIHSKLELIYTDIELPIKRLRSIGYKVTKRYIVISEHVISIDVKIGYSNV